MDSNLRRCEIEPGSGFCNGVVGAIKCAEQYLESHSRLYSLGAIVHNSEEINRLAEKGLDIINYDTLPTLRGETVLIRAHGEPPRTYRLAETLGISLIDCTCPVVLQLQKRIRAAYIQCSSIGGQIVIFGRRGHAEVNGLVGQTDNNAIVIESIAETSKIDFSRHIELFSQTTSDPTEYESIAELCRRQTEDIVVHNTICHQVSNRHSRLKKFASEHDVILFVCGRESSNGKVLFELCRRTNPRSHMVENPELLQSEWLQGAVNIGICGATSTPLWQLEALARLVESK